MPRAGADSGSAFGGGDRGRGGGGFDFGGLVNGIGGKLKSALLFAAMGAAAGIVFPVIPGGPVGGALIGAAVSLLL